MHVWAIIICVRTQQGKLQSTTPYDPGSAEPNRTCNFAGIRKQCHKTNFNNTVAFQDFREMENRAQVLSSVWETNIPLSTIEAPARSIACGP